MTIEEKNKIVLGVAYEVPIVVEEETTTPDGKKEKTLVDKTEVLTLRPIPAKHWPELDIVPLNEVMTPIIAYTARKPKEWVENTLNSSVYCVLYNKCKEVNFAFFDRQTEVANLIEANLVLKKRSGATTEQLTSESPSVPAT
jgi:hypothetical protein